MNPDTYRIPLDTAHHILSTFGITHPTRAYGRWVKAGGFDLKDFGSVLFESPLVFIIDWRSPLDEALETVSRTLDRLGVSLQVELDEEGDSGFVSCGSDGRAAVSYGPDDDDFDDVLRALQTVVPGDIEVRASPWNEGSDTWVYAALPRVEWNALESVSSEAVKHLFRSLPPKRNS